MGKRNGLRKGEGDVTIQRDSRNTEELKISADSRQSQTRKKMKNTRDSQVQKDKRTTNNREPCIVERRREQLPRNKGGKHKTVWMVKESAAQKKNG